MNRFEDLANYSVNWFYAATTIGHIFIVFVSRLLRTQVLRGAALFGI